MACGDKLAELLSELMRRVVVNGTVPPQWKGGRLARLHLGRGDAADCNSHRGLLITDCASVRPAFAYGTVRMRARAWHGPRDAHKHKKSCYWERWRALIVTPVGDRAMRLNQTYESTWHETPCISTVHLSCTRAASGRAVVPRMPRMSASASSRVSPCPRTQRRETSSVTSNSVW